MMGVKNATSVTGFSLGDSEELSTRAQKWFALHCAMLVAILTMLSFSAIAGNTVGEQTVKNQSCTGRKLIQPGADGKFDPASILDLAIAGKKFDHDSASALTATQAMLVQYYGLKQSLRSLPVESDREAMGRITLLMKNNNVVAGQMALGALRPKNNLPKDMMRVLDAYVTTITEPEDEDSELKDIEIKLEKAMAMTSSMSPQARAFARWAMKAAAFEDGVAHDAAMIGFCSSKPNPADKEMLLNALKVAKLDRSKK